MQRTQDTHLHYPKRFYTYLKNNKTYKNGVASPRDECLIHSNSRDKAHILNKQFQSVVTPESALPLSALAQSILPSPYPDMPETQVNELEILKLLHKLKPPRSGGPGNIKPIILRKLATEILQSLPLSSTLHWKLERYLQTGAMQM